MNPQEWKAAYGVMQSCNSCDAEVTTDNAAGYCDACLKAAADEATCPHCGRLDLINLFNGTYCTACQEADRDRQDVKQEQKLGEW